MRLFATIILPFIFVALLVMWGGERLARREMVSMQNVNRDKLQDFSLLVRDELDRVDDLLTQHLNEIAHGTTTEAVGFCKNLVGLKACYAYTNKLKIDKLHEESGSFPQIVFTGNNKQKSDSSTIVIPEELLNFQPHKTSGKILTENAKYQVQWIHNEISLVVFLIDNDEIRQAIKTYLQTWLQTPLKRFQESGELVSITHPNDEQTFSFDEKILNRIDAVMIPHRTQIGTWQIRAWDKKMISPTHDVTTLIITAAITATLCILAVIVSAYQRRAIKLAEERVSFVNRVSHELGTPLTNVLLNLDLAQNYQFSNPSAMQKRLSLVTEEVQRLSRLVANVLTFSRSERKNLTLHETLIIPDDVIANALTQFQASFERREIIIDWKKDAGVPIIMDADALAQIAGNLFSNVEKYAADGKWLGIDTAIKGDDFLLKISDRGTGISHSNSKKVFLPFERVHDSVNEGVSGTGLGLSIVRELVHKMNGSVCYEKNLSGGATFIVTIPNNSHLSLVSQSSVA